MSNAKLGRPTDQRLALLRNQVSYLFWYGKIETTLVRAKSVRSAAERLLTKAINTHHDTVKVVKTIKNENETKVKQEVLNDGPQKLAARRALMSYLYDIQEQRVDKEPIDAYKARIKDVNHPLIEKIFNVYAPKYDERAKKLGQRGGYTRIVKLGNRRGDNAEMALIELI